MPKTVSKKNKKPKPHASQAAASITSIIPDRFYRRADVVRHRFFGVGNTVLDGQIRRGEVPPPIKLSPTGRATGWFGKQLLEHQRNLLKQTG